MKPYIPILISLASYQLVFSQADTEIFLFDLAVANDTVILSNKINISNNEGYDNQPSFYDNNTVLFSSTRNGQTDIRKYDIASGETTWLTDTKVGSEYSPTRIPNSNNISAVRLDTTGLQLLYAYDIDRVTSKPILKDAKVGYHLWYNENILVNTVLIENRMDLVVSNLKENTNYTFQKNVGRCLQQIPGSENISFVQREENQNLIKTINPISGKTDSITTIYNTSDYAWHPLGFAVIGMDNTLMIFDAEEKNQWASLYRYEDKNIQKISRLAISPKGDKIAIVSEVSPEQIVQKQVDSYNAHDLDTFVNCYSEDVWVGRFPRDTFYIGRKKMFENYQSYLKSVESTEVKVTSRIVIGNKVIDQELANDNGKQSHQVAIYEVEQGLISSMNFIFEKKVDNPEPIVQKQLEAYNARDIDAFLKTYSDHVELYNYPNQQTSKGQISMRKRYHGFFESTPDLHCEIKNRIIIGNKVIDEEYLTVKGQNFSAVAIYEVENGKIAKVTFIQ
ncbi:nuclear transport factor 2 family protein [Croceitalea rosinachiae]|uniref:Nuclear transport factor 2 family protein n=1 Tax=Croceitalea rosinachiae TaxID=3075596 RepID=A0ABU3AB02_9FLAO|nr:nuclear transport factor 2 family protein [Croceitalea sp. F388]MDT0607154.1 nuclear transport factor 2 family protein [Croceitalea sp. F388]